MIKNKDFSVRFRLKFHKNRYMEINVRHHMKRKLLGGNYNLKKDPECELPTKTKTNEFESAALENLGGSIAFVRGGNLYEDNE